MCPYVQVASFLLTYPFIVYDGIVTYLIFNEYLALKATALFAYLLIM